MMSEGCLSLYRVFHSWFPKSPIKYTGVSKKSAATRQDRHIKRKTKAAITQSVGRR
jgi:hypothetical protein